jgi:hypothetical protein
LNGYGGVTDIELGANHAADSYSDSDPLVADLDPHRQVLMRFDDIFGSGAGQIPTDVPVVRAEVQVYATDPTPDDISLHRMLTTWSASSTWNTMGSGVSPYGVEAAIMPDDSQYGPGNNAFFTFDVTATVADWQDAPTSNHGWVLLDNGDDGWYIRSSEHATASQRPQLTVEICEGAVDTETDSGQDTGTDTSTSEFSFIVTSDLHEWTGEDQNFCRYFMGALDAMDTVGEGAFMITAGDLSPGWDARWSIDLMLGTDYLWYPAVGNHEMPGRDYEETQGDHMAYLRAYDYDANGAGTPPDIVNTGPTGCPETTYSFEYENAHFAVLNVYCDSDGDSEIYTGDDDYLGDVPDHLYNWLAADLAGASKPFIFVAGHEPAFPLPDEQTSRERRAYDCLNAHAENRDRFWSLLMAEGVTAYFSGHTHNHSFALVGGVWHITIGKTRANEGGVTPLVPNTFLRVTVGAHQVDFETYRAPTTDFCSYALTNAWSHP